MGSLGTFQPLNHGIDLARDFLVSVREVQLAFLLCRWPTTGIPVTSLSTFKLVYAPFIGNLYIMDVSLVTFCLFC